MHPLRLKWIRFRRWIDRWRKITSDDSVAILFDANARIQYLLFVVIGFFVMPQKGYEPWRAHFVNAWEGLIPFGMAFVVFIVLNAIGAIFKTQKQLSAIGTWQGNRFIYHEPLHVLTVAVSAKDNGKPHIFIIHDAEANSLVATRIIFDGGQSTTVKAQIGWTKTPAVTGDFRLSLNSSIRLPNDRRLGLWTDAVQDATPVTIRVYVSSWEL